MNILHSILDSPYFGLVTIVIVIAIFIILKRYQKKKRIKEESITSFSSTRSTTTPIVAKTVSEPVDPITELADAIGITNLSVKIILGIPIQGSCDATTAEEAEGAVTVAEEDSEEWYLALKKWIEFETDIERMEEIHDLAEGYPPLTELLEKKWDIYSTELLAGADTPEKIIEVYENLSPDVEDAAIKKLYAIYTKTV